MTTYRFLRTLWPYIGPVIGAWSFTKGFGITFSEIWAAMAWFVLNTNVWWLLGGGVCFFLTYTSFRHRGVPLTAVDTEVRLVFEDSTAHHVRIIRTQKLRANREDVTGYLRQLWSDGTIDQANFECGIDHATNTKCEFDRNAKGVEILHRFPAIPRNPFTFFTNTVTRTERLLVVDGFPGDEESYQVEIPQHYRHHRLKISLQFDSSRRCALNNVRAIRIGAHGVIDLQPKHATDGVIEVSARKIRGGERFRVYWTLPPVGPLTPPTTVPATGTPARW